MAILTCPKCGAKNRVDENRASQQQPVCGRCGTQLTHANPHGTPLKVTDDTFAREVLRAGKTPVLVDCWAPWCGPCRAIAPIIDQLAAESNGRYIVAKLNTDENPQTAGRYNISSIPAMLIFKEGRLVDQLIGVQPKRVIAGRLAGLGSGTNQG